MSALASVYAQLHELMAPYAARLVTQCDDGEQLYVDTRHLQTNGKPLFFGAVQAKPKHVAYHLMPVYLQPGLLDGLSPALEARRRGKSCFHFTLLEPALRDELAALTAAGYASYQRQGFV